MKFFMLCLLLSLTACTLQPTSKAPSLNNKVQVEVTTQQFVDLPLPIELQKNVNVTQLITAQWGQGKQQQLLVQLEVDEQQVVLAGFSAWGVKLLSLIYASDEAGHNIETHVMTGLSETLPKPSQVLFNVMLAVWPEHAWQAPLASIGWKLKTVGLQRFLLDENDQTVITVDYQKEPYLAGKITFRHHRLDYTVIIDTKN